MEDRAAAAVSKGMVEEPYCRESRFIVGRMQYYETPERLRTELFFEVDVVMMSKDLLQLFIVVFSPGRLFPFDKFDASAQVD